MDRPLKIYAASIKALQTLARLSSVGLALGSINLKSARLEIPAAL